MWEFLFSSLWGWIGVTGVVVIICGAVAWFVPPLRNAAIAVAGAMLAATGIYTKGQYDGRKRKQEQWDAAEQASIKRGRGARDAAERDAEAGVDDGHDRSKK